MTIVSAGEPTRGHALRHSQVRTRTLADALRRAEHDLNNALAVVSGYAEILAQDERIPSDLRESIAEIERGAEAAHAVSVSLRRLARSDAASPAGMQQ